MALIDIRCANGHITEVYRALADWPNTPVCPNCGASTEQVHLPKSVRWTPEPVVVFKAPDGTYRFPGDRNGAGAARYERQGFERIELRGVAEVRRFEDRMNKHEFSRACRRAEISQRAREHRESIMRGDLRMQMQSMTRRGRDLARAAMSHNDNKPRERGKDPGFHSEVYSNYRSNRDESRDHHGRRRRD